MLGITKYQINLFDNALLFEEANKKALLETLGCCIDRYYVQWHTDRDEFNEDGPIILIINGNQYEFTAFQLDYSLTINKIDLSGKLDWYGSGAEMPLVWKKNAFNEINTILGKQIEEIYLLEHGFTDWTLLGIEFEIKGLSNCLQLTNGLDCNNIVLKRLAEDDKNRRYKIKEMHV